MSDKQQPDEISGTLHRFIESHWGLELDTVTVYYEKMLKMYLALPRPEYTYSLNDLIYCYERGLLLDRHLSVLPNFSTLSKNLSDKDPHFENTFGDQGERLVLNRVRKAGIPLSIGRLQACYKSKFSLYSEENSGKSHESFFVGNDTTVVFRTGNDYLIFDTTDPEFTTNTLKERVFNLPIELIVLNSTFFASKDMCGHDLNYHMFIRINDADELRSIITLALKGLDFGVKLPFGFDIYALIEMGSIPYKILLSSASLSKFIFIDPTSITLDDYKDLMHGKNAGLLLRNRMSRKRAIIS